MPFGGTVLKYGINKYLTILFFGIVKQIQKFNEYIKNYIKKLYKKFGDNLEHKRNLSYKEKFKDRVYDDFDRLLYSFFIFKYFRNLPLAILTITLCMMFPYLVILGGLINGYECICSYIVLIVDVIIFKVFKKFLIVHILYIIFRTLILAIFYKPLFVYPGAILQTILYYCTLNQMARGIGGLGGAIAASVFVAPVYYFLLILTKILTFILEYDWETYFSRVKSSCRYKLKYLIRNLIKRPIEYVYRSYVCYFFKGPLRIKLYITSGLVKICLILGFFDTVFPLFIAFKCFGTWSNLSSLYQIFKLKLKINFPKIYFGKRLSPLLWKMLRFRIRIFCFNFLFAIKVYFGYCFLGIRYFIYYKLGVSYFYFYYRQIREVGGDIRLFFKKVYKKRYLYLNSYFGT